MTLGVMSHGKSNSIVRLVVDKSTFQHRVFYTSIASINTTDYVEILLYRRPTVRPSFTARLVGCSLRAPWSGVANSQTDRHRAKVTVGAYMWALCCRSLFWHKIVKITEQTMSVSILEKWQLSIMHCPKSECWI